MGKAGVIWTYDKTTQTDNAESIAFSYNSPWLDLGEELANRLKIIKRLSAIVYASSSTTLNFKYAVDFEGEDLEVIQRSVTATTGSEFNIAEI